MKKLLALTLILCLLASQAWSQGKSFPELRPDHPVDENGIPYGWALMGDIQVPEEFLTAKRGTFATNWWPNGVIPFEFQSNVTTTQRNQALAAMAVLEGVADVDFRPADFDVAYITFRDSSNDETPANNAPVGYFLGFHTVNITSWNFQGVIIHELMHVLGVWHEQSRTDRDAFVQINLNNVQDGLEHNFAIQNGSERYGPYDFGSLMHYAACDFTDCDTGCTPTNILCRTIRVLPPNDVLWQANIGTATAMSPLDILTVSFMYPESNWRFVDDNDGTPSPQGTFLDPWQTVNIGFSNTPAGGTLFIQPGSYDEVVRLDRNVRIEAPLGGVTIGN